MEGSVVARSLGQKDTSVAPVLLEPVGREKGGAITVSGDYKVGFFGAGGGMWPAVVFLPRLWPWYGGGMRTLM